ncbi:nuclear transport factor 2 family protein [Mucilaginibacter gossypii]|uniref:nuclear transport factor 2 family protein n=1 Tax=Mucilaginibacter gossypii TaxID=551996 RepID=UPI000DCDE703|nr:MULTISPECIES: nuclear transport factor 2 family protein [Mucilaginibacter]QTE38552.1 nuclear transport factor 2 family protein [Mucilaginibacter gossypii]RAV52830.1 hypothetical protein DIU36_24060 [Mucilaginibacter rubeus]
METEIEDNGTRTADISSLVLKFLDTATRDPAEWLNLLHDDAVLVFPYAESAGLPVVVAGKDVIKKATASFLQMVPGIRFNNPVVYPTLDPHKAFATYEACVTVAATGGEYEQNYITMFTEQAGKIIEMYEYYDPVKLNAAFSESQK